MTQHFDVVVFGGGPAGSSAAIALLQNGYSVALIEKTDFTEIRIGETIQPQTSLLLKELKITEEIFIPHLCAHAIQSSWGETSLKENNFLFNPFGQSWHLNRIKFDQQLISYAEKAGAQIHLRSNIEAVDESGTKQWIIRFLSEGNEKIIQGRFIVDATGRQAFLSRKRGGKRRDIDHLIGLISIREDYIQNKNTNYTLVESAQNGWWYSADTPGKRMVIVFMTDADLYKKENSPSENFFLQSLSKTKYTNKRCSGFSTDKVIMRAANSYIMTKTHGYNWMAIGDAAMAFDPLSSQGIYKAIKSGLGAANIINEHFSGDSFALEKYSLQLNAVFEKYLLQRKLYYSQEKRWTQSLFWKRRQAAVDF